MFVLIATSLHLTEIPHIFNRVLPEKKPPGDAPTCHQSPPPVNQIEATQKDRDSQLALLRAKRAEDPWFQNVHQTGGGGTKQNVTVDKGQQELLGNQKKVQYMSLHVVTFWGDNCCFFPETGAAQLGSGKL